jgi:rubrerythrin
LWCTAVGHAELRAHLGEYESIAEPEKLKSCFEKQVPKKLTLTYNTYNGKTCGECPNCGHTGLEKDVHDHCWWCGQKIDWNE